MATQERDLYKGDEARTVQDRRRITLPEDVNVDKGDTVIIRPSNAEDNVLKLILPR